MKTAERIERRKLLRRMQAAQGARLDTIEYERAKNPTPEFHPGDDDWLDSDHDYLYFNFQTEEMERGWKNKDQDVWPTGFRGWLGSDGVGLTKDEASALREHQFKKAMRRQGKVTGSIAEVASLRAKQGKW